MNPPEGSNATYGDKAGHIVNTAVASDPAQTCLSLTDQDAVPAARYADIRRIHCIERYPNWKSADFAAVA